MLSSLDGEDDAENMGPGGCVSVWRNHASHCVIRTRCAAKDIASYEVRLICDDGQGGRTRHVFGEGSFDAEELFDTLIICSKCEADAAQAATPAAAAPPAAITTP